MRSMRRGDRPLDSDMDQALAILAKEVGWREARASGEGVGLACAIKDGGGTRTSSTAIVRLHQDGSATVLASSAEIGQGVQSVLGQIAAAELGIDPSRVTVTAPDTGVTPFDQRTNASRATSLLGHAVQEAAQRVADQVRAIAAEALEASPDAPSTRPASRARTSAAPCRASAPRSSRGWSTTRASS